METEKQTLEIFRRLNLNYQRQALVVLSTLLFCQDSQKLSSIPERSVAVPETPSPVAPSPEAATVAESLPETASLPETEPAVAPSPVAPSPTYRLVLNVPEIGLKGFAD